MARQQLARRATRDALAAVERVPPFRIGRTRPDVARYTTAPSSSRLPDPAVADCIRQLCSGVIRLRADAQIAAAAHQPQRAERLRREAAAAERDARGIASDNGCWQIANHLLGHPAAKALARIEGRRKRDTAPTAKAAEVTSSLADHAQNAASLPDADAVVTTDGDVVRVTRNPAHGSVTPAVAKAAVDQYRQVHGCNPASVADALSEYAA